MRVAMRGRRSLKDIRRSLIATLDRMESLGATHSWGTNFYLNPCDENGDEVIIVWGDGTEVEILEIPAPKKHEVPSSSSNQPPRPSSNVVPFARK